LEWRRGGLSVVEGGGEWTSIRRNARTRKQKRRARRGDMEANGMTKRQSQRMGRSEKKEQVYMRQHPVDPGGTMWRRGCARCGIELRCWT
jgi:hypothetical protein